MVPIWTTKKSEAGRYLCFTIYNIQHKKMGAYVFKEEEEDTQISTPHFERYADMMSDPRSPTMNDDVRRTPIVLQDQVEDPRSPAHQYNRTPVFAIPEPGTPNIR